jgi:hypothetical protein
MNYLVLKTFENIIGLYYKNVYCMWSGQVFCTSKGIMIMKFWRLNIHGQTFQHLYLSWITLYQKMLTKIF